MALLGNGLIGYESETHGGSGGETLTSAQVGLWAFLATVTMLFAGFISAILVRRTSGDWQHIPAPPLLWINSGVLILSSITMQRVQMLARRWQREAMGHWLIGTTFLGVLFLIGQIGAWRQLVSQGVYLSGNPHSSFFYILTGAHGVHLLGGLLALVYLLAHCWSVSRVTVEKTTVSLCATYWHFLGALWIALLLVLVTM